MRCTEPSPISPACRFASSSLGDLLQKLRPQPLIDRGAQGEQHTHFAVIELERRHGASREARARSADHKPNRAVRGAALVFAQPASELARRHGVRPKLARRPGCGSNPRTGVGMSPPKAWRGWPEHNPIARTNAPAISPINAETSPRNSPLPLTMERFPPRPVSVGAINCHAQGTIDVPAGYRGYMGDDDRGRPNIQGRAGQAH
jgi:hypothetical protein